MKVNQLPRLFLMILVAAVTSQSNAASSAATASGPTDPEIAHIVVTANTIDVDAGKMATSKTKNEEVKKFAQQMVTDHTAVNKQATELAGKLHVTPKENPTSNSLKTAADDTSKKLKGLKGADFDKAYVDNEVSFHQTVLDAIDKTLLPSAKNMELKALITKVRPAIAAHLEHAKMLQQSMMK